VEKHTRELRTLTRLGTKHEKKITYMLNTIFINEAPIKDKFHTFTAIHPWKITNIR